MKAIHTCIRVYDLEKSIEFYEKALGLKVTKKKDYPEDKFTLVYLGDGESEHEIELTYNYGHEPYDLGNGYSHIAYSVEDLEDAHAEHVRLGYKVTELSGLSDSNRPKFYFITDPDGYDIEIVRKRS
nr:VOC family protein [Miniphocaeibacter massiliensis]